MKIFILIALVASISFVNCSTTTRSGEETAERNKIRNSYSKCKTEKSFSDEKLRKFKEQKFTSLDGDSSAHCFAQCVVKEMKIMEENQIKTGTLEQKIKRFGASDSDSKKCNNVNASDQCEKAYNLLKCVCGVAGDFCTAILLSPSSK